MSYRRHVRVSSTSPQRRQAKMSGCSSFSSFSSFSTSYSASSTSSSTFTSSSSQPPPPPPPTPPPPPPPPTAVVDIHDCVYVCIDDDGDPARLSSIRTRATVAEVTGWRFTFPSWDPPNFFIRWETYHRRFPNVLIVNGLQYY